MKLNFRSQNLIYFINRRFILMKTVYSLRKKVSAGKENFSSFISITKTKKKI